MPLRGRNLEGKAHVFQANVFQTQLACHGDGLVERELA
jgi:hypothetical protein